MTNKRNAKPQGGSSLRCSISEQANREKNLLLQPRLNPQRAGSYRFTSDLQRRPPSGPPPFVRRTHRLGFSCVRRGLPAESSISHQLWLRRESNPTKGSKACLTPGNGWSGRAGREPPSEPPGATFQVINAREHIAI